MSPVFANVTARMSRNALLLNAVCSLALSARSTASCRSAVLPRGVEDSTEARAACAFAQPGRIWSAPRRRRIADASSPRSASSTPAASSTSGSVGRADSAVDRCDDASSNLPSRCSSRPN